MPLVFNTGYNQNTDVDEPGFVSSFQRGLGQSVQGIGQIAEDIGWEDNPIKRYGQGVIDRNPSGVNSLEDIADNPWLAFKEAAGNAASFLVPGGVLGVGGKLAGLGGRAMFAGQTALAGLPSYGGIREQQLSEGHDLLSDKLTAGAGAATVGAIENLFGLQKIPGMAKALGLPVAQNTERQFLRSLAESPIKTGAKAWGKAIGGESVEELMQNPVEQTAAYRDPTTPEAIDETLFGGAMGALGGLGLGGVGGFQAYRGHAAAKQNLAPFIDPSNPTDLLAASENRDVYNFAEQARPDALDWNELHDGRIPASIADYFQQPQAPSAELPWQQPTANIPKEEVTGAFDEVVGTVGERRITAWDAYKAQHPELFGKPVKQKQQNVQQKQQPVQSQAVTELTAAGIRPSDKRVELVTQAQQLEAAGLMTRDEVMGVVNQVGNPKNYPTVRADLAKIANQQTAPTEAAPQDIRSLGEALLSAVQSGRKSRVTGEKVDFGGLLRTYFGFDGTNDEKLAAVAVAHGYPNDKNAKATAWSNIQKGAVLLKEAAVKLGVTDEQAIAAVRALRADRVGDLNLTEDQQEIARVTGALDTALESPNQGKLDFTDAAQQGMLHRELHANPVTEAAKDQSEVAQFNLPAAGTEDMMGPISLAEPEPLPTADSTTTVSFKSKEERKANAGKTVAEIQEERAATAQAKQDVKAKKLEEVVRGDTVRPTYEHTEEEQAKAEALWLDSPEDLGLVPWDELDQNSKDSFTQKVKDVLGMPTVIPNYSALDKHAEYLSDEQKAKPLGNSGAEAAAGTGNRSASDQRSAQGEAEPETRNAPAVNRGAVQESDRSVDGGRNGAVQQTVPERVDLTKLSVAAWAHTYAFATGNQADVAEQIKNPVAPERRAAMMKAAVNKRSAPKAVEPKKPKKVKKAKPVEKTTEEEVAAQWNALSAAYGVVTWKGLNDTQRGALIEAWESGDQVRVESAVEAVMAQLNDVEGEMLETQQNAMEGASTGETASLNETIEQVKEKLSTRFMVGDSVRVGSTPGVVVGVDGDYIRFRPDNTVHPKGFQRVQAKTATFVSRPDTTITSSASKSEFGSEDGKLNADMGGLIKLLGANMYASNIADVSVKELLQNAFDAVKGAIKVGLITQGKIDIRVNRDDRTISVTDNARGMTPEIVKNAFFTVAGSDKSDLDPSERSGGLGLAKMGFMLGADTLTLDTVRDGVRTTVDTTAQDIANSNFKIRKTPAPKTAHGTTVTVKIPTSYTDPKTGDQKTIWFPYSDTGIDALQYPLVGPTEVSITFDSGYEEPTTKVLPVGVNFDDTATPKLTTAHFSWGDAEIYYGVNRKEYPSHRVLSSGVYQFEKSFSLNQNERIPYDIIVNVKPNVDAKHPDYPFENSRERFKGRIDADIKSLQAYLAKVARGNEAADLQENFKGIVSMPRIEAGQELADASKKLKKAFDKRTGDDAQTVRELPELPADINIRDGVVTDTTGRELATAKPADNKKESTFTADKDAPSSADFMLEMKQDPKLPIFHNNTNVDYLEIGRAYGNPEQFFAELGTLMVEMKETMAQSGLWGYDGLGADNLFFGGISVDRQYGGVHIKVPYKAVLINPFYDWGAKSLFGVRRNLFTTMVHEIAHQGTMDHGVGHNGQMIRVEQYLADQGLEDYYRDALLDILTKHESTFTAMREAYGRSTTSNIAKSLEDYGKGSAAASSRGNTNGADDQLRAVQTGGRQRGDGPVQTAGRSGQQRQVGGGTGSTGAVTQAGETAFSRASGAGTTTSKVQSVVDAIKKRWANAPRIVVLDTPPSWAVPDARGAFHQGAVYLFASNLNGKTDIAFTLFHEALGHYGLRGFFGKGLDAQLRTVAGLNKNIREAANKWVANNKDIQTKYGLSSDEMYLKGIEEALSDMAGTGKAFNGLRKLMNWIQSKLRSLGFTDIADRMENWTDAEALALLAKAKGYVTGEQQTLAGKLATAFNRTGGAAPLWYSRAAQHVLSKGPGKAPAAVWMSNLNSWAKSGAIKPEEIQWSGVENWLKGQTGTVSREDVAQFFNEGGVQVEEKVLGKKTARKLTQQEEDRLFELREKEITVASLNAEEYAELNALDATLDEYRNNSGGGTHYSSYTEPGAKEGSYREILLKLPKGDGTRLREGLEYAQMDDGTWNLWDTKGYTDEGDGEWVFIKGFPSKTILEMRAAEDHMLTIHGEPAKHRAPHYGNDNENILATARINERTDAEGNRVLYVEEIQSDWAQDKRKETKPTAEQKSRFEELDKLSFDQMSEDERIEYDKLLVAIEGRKAEVADAPFIGKTEQWAGLILKRLMRYAADNGFDKVAWSTGEQQFKRWGSERVSWGPGEAKVMPFVTKLSTGDRIQLVPNAEVKERNGRIYIQVKNVGYISANEVEELDASMSMIQVKNWIKQNTTLKKGLKVSAQEQYGGRIDGVAEDLEALARQRGELLEKSNQLVESKEDLRKILRETMRRENNEQQIDAMTDKLWGRMQTEPEGDFMPRREGMRGFYGDEQGRAPDGKPSWLANALKALPAEIRPKVESVALDSTALMDPDLRSLIETGAVTPYTSTNPGFTVDKSLANRPMPLYSRKIEPSPTMSAIADKLAPAKTEAGDFWSKVKPKLLTIHQIVDQYGDKLASLGRYVKAIDTMEQFQQQLATGAHPIVLDWQKLTKKQRVQLHRVMLDATMWGIHPDKPMEEGVDADKYNDLKSRYSALPSESRQVYNKAREYLASLWKQRTTVFDELVTSAYARLITLDPGNTKKLEAKRDKLIAEHTKAVHSIKGPYFPLLRFGDYLAIGKSVDYTTLEKQIEDADGATRTAMEKQLRMLKSDPKHYAVYASEHKSLAESKAAELSARGLQTKVQLAEDHPNALMPFSATGMEKLRALFSSQFDGKTSNKLDRLMTEVYISSLPEHTALQRQLKRIGVEGAEENQLRAFARAVEQDSFHLSRMKYNDEISGLLFDVSREAKAAGVEYQHVANNLKQRIDLDYKYEQTPILSMLGRLSSFWHLGVSPAYLFTNSTQPWMIALPNIAGRHGFGSTLKAMSTAWNDAKNMIVQSKKDGAFADIKFDTLSSKDEQDMLQSIRNLGQIDITINFDLGNTAESISPALLKLQKSLAWANHHIEVSNRITTALAAYRLARGSMGHEEATQYAYKQVIDTQLDYSNANAAYFMKSQHLGGLNKLIMQFRKYQQGMFYLLARNGQLAFKGDKQALRSLGYLMAMQGAFAGAAGVPFLSMAMFLAGFGLDDDDPDGDAETQFRNFLADAMGADAAQVFYKGLPAMLGMDLSKRIGLGDIWDPTPFYDMKDFKKAKTGKEAVSGALFALAGPAVGTMSNFADAAVMAESGQLGKAAEKMLPKVAADVFRAARYGDEGLTTRTGAPVIGADQFTSGELLQRGLGFASTKETEHYAAQEAKMDTQARIKDRREKLIASWARYKLVGDPEDLTAMNEAVKLWNDKHPEKGARIDRDSLLKAVQQRRKNLQQTNSAGVRYSKSEGYLKGIDRFAGTS